MSALANAVHPIVLKKKRMISSSEFVRPIFDDKTIDLTELMPYLEPADRGEVFLWLQIDGFFWFPRYLLGIERHLFAFYDQPELLHRINTDLANWMTRAIDDVCKICTPDFMAFSEDLSYNHGPMLSKEFFGEFLRPYYQKVVPQLKERGIFKNTKMRVAPYDLKWDEVDRKEFEFLFERLRPYFKV